MFKYAVVIFAVIAGAVAKPHLIGAPLAYSAPLVAAPAPIVTATSSQVVTRTHNGIASAPIIAPAARIVAPVAPFARVIAPAHAHVAAPVAPFARVIAPTHAHIAAPHAHVAAPLTAAYTAPAVARYATTAAYTAPFAAGYAAAPLTYSAPLTYPHAHYAASYAW